MHLYFSHLETEAVPGSEEIEHYTDVVAALGKTVQIMAARAEVIEACGGWPLAGKVKEEQTTEG